MGVGWGGDVKTFMARRWWKIVCRINCQLAKTTNQSWMTWIGHMSALGNGDGNAMFLDKTCSKKIDLTWQRCSVTRKMPCHCGYENGRFLKCHICNVDRKTHVKLKITIESTLKNDTHQAKKRCKTHDCQDWNYAKHAILHKRKENPAGCSSRSGFLMCELFA